MNIRGNATGNYRGMATFNSPEAGTGGNQVFNAKTGEIKQGVTGQWHPTVLYLLALLVVEWAAFLLLSKYL